MKMRTTALIMGLFGAILAPDFALAGQKVTVGDETVDASFITPFTKTFDLEIFDADGNAKPNGFWIDEVSHADADGQKQLRRKVTLFNARGELIFDRVHVVDAKTLAPVRMEQIGYRPIEFLNFFLRYTHQEFEEGKVTQNVVLENGGPLQTAEAEVSEAPFDYSIWATILMSLPFEEGAEYQIPIFAQNQVVEETVYIRRLETVTLKNGETYDAWKVETNLRPWTTWVRKEAPFAVKFIQNLPDGGYQVSHMRSE